MRWSGVLPSAAALEAQRPPRQCFLIHPIKAVHDGIVRQGFTNSFRHQFTFQAVTAHRPARQRRLDPSVRHRPDRRGTAAQTDGKSPV